MAYTDPTADELQAAFPRFADVADATVEYWLVRARRVVDESWTEDDYQMGQMLLAAHYMTLNGLGTGAEAETAANGTGDYQSIKSGSLTLTRFQQSGSSTAQGELRSTTYGRQFDALLRQNKAGPRVMGTGALPTSPLFRSA